LGGKKNRRNAREGEKMKSWREKKDCVSELKLYE